jgi:hypothetical protein
MEVIMVMPNPNEKVPASIPRSHRLLSRVKAIAEILEPTGLFEAAVTLLESRYNEWIVTRRQVTVAIVAQKEAQGLLNQELRGVGLAILTVGRGRRSYDVYRMFFPNGYGSVLRLSPTESIATATGIIAVMTDEIAPRILACREPLTAACALFENALAARQSAMNSRSEAKVRVQEEKIAWRKAYMKFYFDLRYHYADHRSYVESLFRMPGRVATEEDGTPDEPAVTDPAKMAA